MFEAYRNRMAYRGKNMSEMLRMQSNMVIEQTWDRDPNARKVYVVKVDSGLPEVTVEHELIDVKFNVQTYANITSDEPAYLLQFRHGAEKKNLDIAIGSYVYMEDEDGNWKWWLLVYEDERPQFKQWQILECNRVFKWINEGKIYESLGVQRVQQSYNSGSWSGDRFDFVDNITSAWIPTNHETLSITYNHRFMISDPNREIPLVWAVSKVEDTQPIGLIKLKFTQETYSPTLDNKELMLCNFYSSEIEPEVPDIKTELKSAATITYSGTKSAIKVGGSWKTFIPIFNDESITVSKWIISDENGEVSGNTENYTIEYDSDNKLKLKVARNYNLIGKVLTIRVIGSDGSAAEIQIEVIG